MTGRKLHKHYSKKYYSYNSISNSRNSAMGAALNCLCIPHNEKEFNLESIRDKNHKDKTFKKDNYQLHIARHDETDRMKKERHMGSKKLRRVLDRELQDILNDELE